MIYLYKATDTPVATAALDPFLGGGCSRCCFITYEGSIADGSLDKYKA